MLLPARSKLFTGYRAEISGDRGRKIRRDVIEAAVTENPGKKKDKIDEDASDRPAC